MHRIFTIVTLPLFILSIVIIILKSKKVYSLIEPSYYTPIWGPTYAWIFGGEKWIISITSILLWVLAAYAVIKARKKIDIPGVVLLFVVWLMIGTVLTTLFYASYAA